MNTFNLSSFTTRKSIDNQIEIYYRELSSLDKDAFTVDILKNQIKKLKQMRVDKYGEFNGWQCMIVRWQNVISKLNNKVVTRYGRIFSYFPYDESFTQIHLVATDIARLEFLYQRRHGYGKFITDRLSYTEDDINDFDEDNIESQTEYMNDLELCREYIKYFFNNYCIFCRSCFHDIDNCNILNTHQCKLCFEYGHVESKCNVNLRKIPRLSKKFSLKKIFNVIKLV